MFLYTSKNPKPTEEDQELVIKHGDNAKPGDVLPLTEEQARYALITGELEPEAKPAREAASKAPKAALEGTRGEERGTRDREGKKDDKKAASAD